MSARPAALVLCLLSLACVDEGEVLDSGTGSSDTEAGGAPEFDDVPCESNVCGPGELCVYPGEYCDFGEDGPQWIQDPPSCQPIPDDCASSSDWEECVEKEMCEVGEKWISKTDLPEGVLWCFPVDLDCFEEAG